MKRRRRRRSGERYFMKFILGWDVAELISRNNFAPFCRSKDDVESEDGSDGGDDAREVRASICDITIK